MLKIILVDDEDLSVRMFINLIDWKSYGIQIAGTAHTGQEAWELYLRERPDIVMTDIRMPCFDGLELTRRIKELDSSTEIILVSAYADFAYAQQAIALGSANYLLKPVDEMELEKALKKIVEKIDSKKAAHRVVEIAEAQKNTIALSSYLRNGSGKGAAIKAGARLGLQFDRYALMSFTLNESSMNSYIQNSLQIDAQLNYIHSQLSQHLQNWFPALLFEYYGTSWCALLQNPDDSLSECAADMAHFFAEHLHMEVHVCFTEPVSGLEQLPQSYSRLQQLQEYSCFIGSKNILGYGFNCESGAVSETAFYDAGLSLKATIETGDLSRSKATLEETLRALPLHTPELLPHVRNFCYVGLRALQEASRRAGNSDLGSYLCRLTYQDIENCGTVEELLSFMNDALEKAGSPGGRNEQFSPLVQNGMAYLNENYDRNLSLEEICDALGVSRNYFSFLFKKETGENVWSYLAKIRLNKAKQLLRTTNDKTYTIAYQVGYDNPSYFSKLFKKCTGMTPNEYRRSL